MSGTHTQVSRRTLAFIIFIAALLLRFAYIASLEIDNPIRADAFNYFTLAYNVVVNGTYSLSTSEPFMSTTYVTPGYPLFLASILSLSEGIEFFYWAVLIVQGLLSSLSAVIAFCLSGRFMNRYFSFAAGICVAFSPHLNVFSGYVLTETLFTFLFLISILVLTKATENRALSYYLIAGLLFAAASLVRPALLLFPFVIFFILIRLYGTKTNRKAIASFILGFIIILSPWYLWKSQNKVENEVNLLPAAIALGGYPDLIHEDPNLRGFPYREDPEYNKMVKSSKYAVSVIWERAKDEPVKYLTWYLWGKLVTFWQPGIIAGQGGVFVYPVKHSLYDKVPVAEFSLILFFVLQPVLVFLALIYSVFILVYKLVLSKVKETEQKQVHFSLYVIAGGILYFTAIHMVLAPLPRYSIPLYPLVFIIACAAIVKFKSYLIYIYKGT